MPLLDDKGKLFGKINLIDLTAAVLIVLILGVALGIRLRGGELVSHAAFIHRHRSATVTVVLRPELSWMKDDIRVGDTKNDLNGPVARVLEVGHLNVDGAAPDAVTVVLWVKARVSSEGRLFFSTYELLKGRRIELLTADYRIEGHIYSVEAAENEAE